VFRNFTQSFVVDEAGPLGIAAPAPATGKSVIVDTWPDTAPNTSTSLAVGPVAGVCMNHDVNSALAGAMNPKLFAGSAAGSVVLPTSDSRPA
jgi:hypothetical protein